MINHYWDSLIVPDWCKRPIPFRKCSRRYDFVFLVAKSFAIEMMPIEERNAAQPVSWAVVILTWKPLQKKDAISLCHGLRRWFQLARLLLGGDISQALTCQGEHSFWNVLPAWSIATSKTLWKRTASSMQLSPCQQWKRKPIGRYSGWVPWQVQWKRPNMLEK